MESVVLHVDSRQRDTTKYPSPNAYVLDLPEPLRNVSSVELVYAVYHKFGNETYFTLSVEELEPNVVSCSNSVTRSFTQLPLLNMDLNVYTHMAYRSVKRFAQPRGKISRLTIRLLNQDGRLAPIKEHVLRFEVTFATGPVVLPPLATEDTDAVTYSKGLKPPPSFDYAEGFASHSQDKGGTSTTKKVVRGAVLAAVVGGAAFAAYRTFPKSNLLGWLS